MAAVLDSFKPFSSELSVIERLNHSLRHGVPRDTQRRSGRSARAPLRVDVPLLDPCSGQISAGAEVNLGVGGRRPFVCLPHVTSDLWVPRGLRDLRDRNRARTAPQPVSLSLDLSRDKDWNSRRVPHSAQSARINANPDEVLPDHVTQAVCSGVPQKPEEQQADSSDEWTDIAEAVRHFRYTSATQRSYEEVQWDTKLPRRLKAPDTTLEKMADAVSDRPSTRRYHSRPQLWQSTGAEWNRQQLRSQQDVRKPITFCSGCPRSGQIPLYTGTIGSNNMENIDNMDAPFTPLTLKRSVLPPFTPTSRRTTIPGYTGKGLYSDSAPGNVSSSAQIPGTQGGSASPVFGHSAPLSRLVTSTHPCNPFLQPSSSSSSSSRTKTR